MEELKELETTIKIRAKTGARCRPLLSKLLELWLVYVRLIVKEVMRIRTDVA
ncbi:MAG: hypothetical protein ACE5IW_13725 [bacterium]